MKIETKLRDDHQADVTVELDAEILEKNKRIAAKHIAKKIKIPGFRPGKAPYNIVLKHVGEAAIVEDALDHMLDEVYPQMLEQAKLSPYGPGSLREVPSLDPPTLEITVPLAPQVSLGKYTDIRIPFESRQVNEQDIEKVIDNLREQQAVIEKVERAAQEGDMVTVTLHGERLDGAEGGSTTFIEERKMPVLIEKKETDNSDEWPFPGYSRHLIGLSVGDEKSIEHKFSKDYEVEELQGVKAHFPSRVEEVKARSLPARDDELARSTGDYADLEALIEAIRKSLAERYESEQNSEYESQIVDKVIEASDYKYPPQMIEHEIEHQIEELTRSLRSQGLDLEIYLKSRGITQEALNDELRPQAEDRIKRGLTLLEIAKAEGIEAQDAEVRQRLENVTSEIRQIFSEEEAKRLLTERYLHDLDHQIRNDLVITNTLSRLREIAQAPAEKSTPAKPAKKSAAKTKKSTPKAKTAKTKKTTDAPEEPSKGA